MRRKWPNFLAFEPAPKCEFPFLKPDDESIWRIIQNPTGNNLVNQNPTGKNSKNIKNFENIENFENPNLVECKKIQPDGISFLDSDENLVINRWKIYSQIGLNVFCEFREFGGSLGKNRLEVSFFQNWTKIDENFAKFENEFLEIRCLQNGEIKYQKVHWKFGKLKVFLFISINFN